MTVHDGTTRAINENSVPTIAGTGFGRAQARARANARLAQAVLRHLEESEHVEAYNV